MDELDARSGGSPNISKAESHRAGLAMLDDMARAYTIACQARGRDFDDWWEQASHEERLASIDMHTPGTPPLCADPAARERATVALTDIENRRTRFREHMIASSRQWRTAIARARSDAPSAAPPPRPRARGAGRPARRRAHRTRAGPSGASDDSGDPPEPPARRLVTTALARLIRAAGQAMRNWRR